MATLLLAFPRRVVAEKAAHRAVAARLAHAAAVMPPCASPYAVLLSAGFALRWEGVRFARPGGPESRQPAEWRPWPRLHALVVKPGFDIASGLAEARAEVDKGKAVTLSFARPGVRFDWDPGTKADDVRGDGTTTLFLSWPRIEALSDLVKLLNSKATQMVSLTGCPGIGKTRMIEGLVLMLRCSGNFVVYVPRCKDLVASAERTTLHAVVAAVVVFAGENMSLRRTLLQQAESCFGVSLSDQLRHALQFTGGCYDRTAAETAAASASSSQLPPSLAAAGGSAADRFEGCDGGIVGGQKGDAAAPDTLMAVEHEAHAEGKRPSIAELSPEHSSSLAIVLSAIKELAKEMKGLHKRIDSLEMKVDSLDKKMNAAKRPLECRLASFLRYMKEQLEDGGHGKRVFMVIDEDKFLQSRMTGHYDRLTIADKIICGNGAFTTLLSERANPDPEAPVYARRSHCDDGEAYPDYNIEMGPLYMDASTVALADELWKGEGVEMLTACEADQLAAHFVTEANKLKKENMTGNDDLPEHTTGNDDLPEHTTGNEKLPIVKAVGQLRWNPGILSKFAAFLRTETCGDVDPREHRLVKPAQWRPYWRDVLESYRKRSLTNEPDVTWDDSVTW
jgi:hypothetical protein